jgi:hypothetical protein
MAVSGQHDAQSVLSLGKNAQNTLKEMMRRSEGSGEEKTLSPLPAFEYRIFSL